MDPFDPMDPSGYAEPASTLDFLSFWVCSALPGLIVTALLVLGVLLLHRLVHQTRRIADALERRQDGEAASRHLG